MTDVVKDFYAITNLSDDHVKQWYERGLSMDPNKLGDKVREIIKHHKHQQSADPEAGVQYYVFSFTTYLRALGGARFMNHKSHAKRVINRLANGLNPTEFKDLLFRDKLMRKEGEHSSISHFLSRAGDIATQVQRLEELRTSPKIDGAIKNSMTNGGKNIALDDNDGGSGKKAGHNFNKKQRAVIPVKYG